jgi:hypothetical protein
MEVIENERTAKSQHATRQPDGPGKRIGKKGEISFLGKTDPAKAKLFRERIPQIQAEAAYWEDPVGTVEEIRATLINNDTQLLVTIVYDGDFKPYLEDVLRNAGPWLDQVFGAIEGFKSSKDRNFECDVFYVANPDVTARDVAKMQRLSKAVGELMDAAA